MDSIETRLRDAKLGSAIENAASKLPEGWMVSINIDRGGCGVSLFNPDGDDVEVEQSEFLADDINNAVAEAVAIATGDDASP